MAETVSVQEHFSTLTDNRCIGAAPELKNSSITFTGSNNVLYCEEGVRLESCKISFAGNNGLVILGKSKHAYHLHLSVNNNCSIVFGRDVYFNGCLNAIASEECSIVIGDHALISFGIWMRTADPHLIYDASSFKRINKSKNIIVGDHVWIGQNAMILKGSLIGSGSIVGAMSVISGKTIPSNTVWAGNPAKLVKDNVFWDGSVVHTWTSEMTKKHETLKTEKFLFKPGAKTLRIEELIPQPQSSAEDRLAHFLAIGYDNQAHERLAIALGDNHKKLKRRFFS